MARLEIRLLGPLEVTLDDSPVTGFETNSARALLAYLASEPGRFWPRPSVAEMLWPDRPEGAALSNLRHVLSVLRSALGDREAANPVLLSDAGTLAIATSKDVWVDLVEFERLAGTPAGVSGAAEAWLRAVDLWRGPLLDGLTVRAGADWEEWVLVTAERVRLRLAVALGHLVDHLEHQGSWGEAIETAERLTEIDPWDERTHRQLMRLLARTGESPRALSCFVELEDRLRSELGTAPAPETRALADQIRAGDLAAVGTEVEIDYPAFFASAAPPRQSTFVGRKLELGQLREHLDSALAGRGRMVFVAGEAGSGKTMLAAEFMRRCIEIPDLLVAQGRCNAFGGVGDPYLPFRELLSLLCGDVESAYTSGALDREQAVRLWEAIPHSARLVADVGPSLVGVMVNGALLIERIEQALPAAGWRDELLRQVETLVQRRPAERVQPALFAEYTAVLERLAITRPLLLVIDDLHWADRASIALLWHLARRIEGMRALVVGVYRPEDIPSEPGDIASLDSVLRELEAATPGRVVELGKDRPFIDEFLDSEPNEFDTAFRDRLFTYTGGNALFTVEQVRGMQERGEIHRDRAGVWRVREPLDWDRLPSRVEAVINQRIARLAGPMRRDLSIASIQGEEFVAEIVARVGGDAEAPARMSQESGLPHRLVEPAGATRVDGRMIARHRFRHALFQRYLYDRLDDAERMRLHEATARAFEGIYGNHPDLPVVDLARHFDEAGLIEPAIDYLERAGQRALQMSAGEEAIGLLERARVLLSSLPESTARDERELALLAALLGALMAARGYACEEAEHIGVRVRELCNRLDPSPTAALALLGLASVSSMQARYEEALATSREARAISEALQDSALEVATYRMLGYMQTWVGELAAGHDNLRHAYETYDPNQHAWLIHAIGAAEGPEAMVWDAFNTVYRGYLEQATALVGQGVELARSLGHTFTLGHVIGIGAIVHLSIGDYHTALRFADEEEAIARATHFPFWEIGATLHRGMAIGHLGDAVPAIEGLTAGLDAWRAMGIEAFRGWFLSVIAECEMVQGRIELAGEVIEAALSEVRASGEYLTETHLQQQRGRVLAAAGDVAGAISSLEKAVDDAEAIGARLIQLQAATELATLHLCNDDPRRAEDVLAPVYSWFTEGLDTRHLAAARAVLEQL